MKSLDKNFKFNSLPPGGPAREPNLYRSIENSTAPNFVTFDMQSLQTSVSVFYVYVDTFPGFP